MVVIPVVDLQQGRVVRARHGDRAAYRPIVSSLAAGSEPVVLARALLRHTGARCLYVADLDALTGGAVQHDALRALLDALPATELNELWLDAGFADVAGAQALLAALSQAGRVVPVFGSESLRNAHALRDVAARADAVLSLDRRGADVLDRAGCWDSPAHWPPRVIAMTLERVGSDAGPDLDTLAALRARAPGCRFIGAGGVRGPADLDRARAAGAHGWLVASALHDGRLPPAAAA
jgi:uncharacterized protein related to proFAR isomerase